MLTKYPAFHSPNSPGKRFLWTKPVLSQTPQPYVNKRYDKTETKINTFIAHIIAANEIPFGVKFSAVVLKPFSEHSPSLTGRGK